PSTISVPVCPLVFSIRGIINSKLLKPVIRCYLHLYSEASVLRFSISALNVYSSYPARFFIE
ncbi:hypothetical protein, partial [Anaplasma phagocytophilum]|uniref:hypothetical protein n=1 Tax=Anaplasma phagocytophilum TaxID=948 RepID=UPI000AF22169